MSSEMPNTALALSLVGGILMLLGGILPLIFILSGGYGYGYGGMIGGFGMMGGWGGPFGLIGLIAGIVVIISAVMLNTRPAEHTTFQ